MADYPVQYPVQNYYNRFDPAKQYEKLLARAGYRIQSAETNDMQEAFLWCLKSIADALFRDGAVISGAQIAVDAATGETRAESGVIYLQGGMRPVSAATFTIPLQGEVSVGVYVRETVISELEDPGLRNPAVGTRGEGDAGAWRLKVEALWGFYGDGGLLLTLNHGAGRGQGHPDL